MSDQETAADMAGDNDLLPGEDQQFGTAAQPEPDTSKPEGDEPQEAAEPEGDDKPKKETAKERRERDKAYKQRLREEADEAKRAAEQAQQRRDQIRMAGQQEQPPKEADFDDYSDFVAAKAVWNYTRKAAENEATSAEKEADTARQRAQAIEQQQKALAAQSWQQQAQEASTRIADFNEVITAPGLFPEGTHLPDLIMDSDSAADLAYAVAKDRALHDRLLSMQPLEAARELGRLESRLTAPKPRTETKAPDPLSPIRPKASAMPSIDSMSVADYRAARESGRIK